MKTRRIAALLALGLASAGLVAPTALANPPPWAPAYGYRAHHHHAERYRYVYFPAAEVYYAPATRMWFWLGGDGWRAGVRLPVALHGYVRAGGVDIHLDTGRPYLRNAYVVRRHGGHHHRWRGDDDDHGYYWRHGDDDDDD